MSGQTGACPMTEQRRSVPQGAVKGAVVLRYGTRVRPASASDAAGQHTKLRTADAHIQNTWHYFHARRGTCQPSPVHGSTEATATAAKASLAGGAAANATLRTTPASPYEYNNQPLDTDGTPVQLMRAVTHLRLAKVTRS